MNLPQKQAEKLNELFVQNFSKDSESGKDSFDNS